MIDIIIFTLGGCFFGVSLTYHMLKGFIVGQIEQQILLLMSKIVNLETIINDLDDSNEREELQKELNKIKKQIIEYKKKYYSDYDIKK